VLICPLQADYSLPHLQTERTPDTGHNCVRCVLWTDIRLLFLRQQWSSAVSAVASNSKASSTHTRRTQWGGGIMSTLLHTPPLTTPDSGFQEADREDLAIGNCQFSSSLLDVLPAGNCCSLTPGREASKDSVPPRTVQYPSPVSFLAVRVSLGGGP